MGGFPRETTTALSLSVPRVTKAVLLQKDIKNFSSACDITIPGIIRIHLINSFFFVIVHNMTIKINMHKNKLKLLNVIRCLLSEQIFLTVLLCA